MWERVILATVITFCIYLFLNLGGKSSTEPSFYAENNTISKPIFRFTIFSLNS